MLTDFSVQIEKGKKFTILQLTDMQVIDAEQRRYPDRLSQVEIDKWQIEKVWDCCYNGIKKTIELTKPDLILITGDVVYGSFDDKGTTLDSFIDFMDSFGITWSPVYGNHDNESKIGVAEQSRRLANGKHCLFRRGYVSGNCNFTIGLYEGDELVRVIYMLDSNADWNKDAGHYLGFYDDQVEWFRKTARGINSACGRKIPSFFCCHVPTADLLDAEYEAGYLRLDAINEEPSYSIGYPLPAAKTVVPAVNEGDWGCNTQQSSIDISSRRMEDDFIELGVDGEFAGHLHNKNVSVARNGIRYTLGVKCGSYDFHMKDQLGGTKIVIDKDRHKFTVEPVYNDLDIKK